jgi:hypothetical protein
VSRWTVCAAYLQKHGYTVDQIKLSKEQLFDVVKVTKFNYNDEFWRAETDEFDGVGRNKLIQLFVPRRR